MRATTRLRRAWVVVTILALCTACTQPAPGPTDRGPPVTTPVRFLLTFDDGPSTWEPYNPTRAILDQLQQNEVQPEVKAIFFVQTRDPRAGGGAAGQVLLRRIHAEGHVLALHSGSARGHVSHTRLSDAGTGSIPARRHRRHRGDLLEQAPTLVRPPFWRFDERTLAIYHARHLLMLLTDISARDGKIYGWNISLRRRSHFQAGLTQVKRAIQDGTLQTIDGVVPVVVTFHDTNTFTASHMQEYLEILVDKAHAVGLPLTRLPFYNDSAQIQRVAGLRARGRGLRRHAVTGNSQGTGERL